MPETNEHRDPLRTLQPLQVNISLLSYAQQALWFLYQLAPDDATYNMGFSARICSEVDVRAFQQAFQDLLDRHASLRTTFFERSGIPMQEIHEDQDVQFEQIDASTWDENKLHENVIETSRKPFDLRCGPVVRVHLYTRSKTEHVFLLAAHRIVFDTSSLWKLLNEFQNVYADRKSAVKPSLPSLRAEYANYVQWERDRLNSPAGDDDWEYWQKQFAGDLPVLNLPTDRPHPAISTNKVASHSFIIEKDLTQKLKSVAQAEKTTLYATLLAAFQTLLGRYSGQDDFFIGSSVSSRNQPGFAEVVGHMDNIVALRVDLSGDPTFATLLKRTHQTVMGMREHQHYPFPQLVERLKLQRGTKRSALDQVFFDFRSAGSSMDLATLLVPGIEKAQVDFSGLNLEPYYIPQQEDLADLGLQVFETDEDLRVTLIYKTDLFDASTITRMGRHFLTLLASVVFNPEEQVSKLLLLTEQEQSQILIEEYPLAPNTKIDQKALPAPDHSRPELEDQDGAPRDEMEASLAGIFADLLIVEYVSIHDNFFELGGNSLLAIQVISRLRETFQMEIPLNSLFGNPTVLDLAEHIRTMRMVVSDMQPVENNTTEDYEEEEL